METLANLGTAIPKPAFAKCMEATLAVWLGNPWGHSWGAAPHARTVFESLRTEQWEYYLNECLRRDRTVLDKIAGDEKPVARWIELVQLYGRRNRTVRDVPIRELSQSSKEKEKVRTSCASQGPFVSRRLFDPRPGAEPRRLSLSDANGSPNGESEPTIRQRPFPCHPHVIPCRYTTEQSAIPKTRSM